MLEGDIQVGDRLIFVDHSTFAPAPRTRVVVESLNPHDAYRAITVRSATGVMECAERWLRHNFIRDPLLHAADVECFAAVEKARQREVIREMGALNSGGTLSGEECARRARKIAETMPGVDPFKQLQDAVDALGIPPGLVVASCFRCGKEIANDARIGTPCQREGCDGTYMAVKG